MQKRSRRLQRRPRQNTEALHSRSALCPPQFPSRFENRQIVFLLVWMLEDFLDVQVDAETRAVRDLEVAILKFDASGHDLLFPRLVELIEDFMDEEVGDRRIQLHARG